MRMKNIFISFIFILVILPASVICSDKKNESDHYFEINDKIKKVVPTKQGGHKIFFRQHAAAAYIDKEGTRQYLEQIRKFQKNKNLIYARIRVKNMMLVDLKKQ